MIDKNKLVFVFLGLLIALSCQDPYVPGLSNQDQSSVLVVEGFINASGPQTRYILSRTIPIQEQDGGENDQSTRVSGARISIEREDGLLYQDQHIDSEGAYILSHAALDASHRYRLRIVLGQDEYISDFVEVKQSPEIEGVSWEETEGGVQLYVSTKDENNASHYYLWEYEETWRFSAQYHSSVVFENGVLRDRLRDEMVNVCFFSETSSAINITTTTGLGKDVVHEYPITLIAPSSEKIELRYSILVKQRVLSKEGFSYWDNMKKNSENLGDIFGTMPVELRGNIQNVNNTRESVIGLVEAGTITEKRVFIDQSDLDIHRYTRTENPFYAGCSLSDTLTTSQTIEILQNSNSLMPVYGLSQNPASPIPTHYLYSTRRCADCTVRGRRDAPAFWEE